MREPYAGLWRRGVWSRALRFKIASIYPGLYLLHGGLRSFNTCVPYIRFRLLIMTSIHFYELEDAIYRLQHQITWF